MRDRVRQENHGWMKPVQCAWLLGVSLCLGAGCTGPGASSEAPGVESVPASSSAADGEPAVSASSATDGKLGPFIPFHKDAIHSGFYWDAEGKRKMLFWMRPAEYRGTDLVDPSVDPVGALKQTFRELVYGTFNFSQTLDASVKSRIMADIERENTLVFDPSHPEAFRNRGKFDVEALDEEDFGMNAPAFSDAGSSAGLSYNVFCSGHAVLPDGRWVVVGGHDKGGNNGIRKVNIFDPHTEQWVHRRVPPVKADFMADPTGEEFEHADPLDEDNTDPHIPSDMRYQRWYPSAVTLPDGQVLILSGTDQDTSLGPELSDLSKVRQPVPEVYDPKLDRTIALENARKLFPMYPRTFVIETGQQPHDWKVAVVPAVTEPIPTGPDLAPFDPFIYDGETNVLDVRAALADPKRDEPAERHWTKVAQATYAHHHGASAALWKLDDKGHAVSQRVMLFGGIAGEEALVSTIEMIDFSDPTPEWQTLPEELVRPAEHNNAVVLPNGQVVVAGGIDEEGADVIPTYEIQLVDPEAGTVRTVAQTTAHFHDHSTMLLAPDGSVYLMGGNRTEVVLDDPNAGVPVLQIYKPAYMFQGSGPVIERAPERISYRQSFPVELSDDCKSTGSVVIHRTEPVTHNWSWGNRHVELTFKEVDGCKLNVRAPATGATGPGGNYLLFVLDEDGVPSEAKHIVLR